MSSFIPNNEHFLKRARNIRNELLNRTDRYFLIDYPIASSNRSWAYGGENFYAPSASKICLPHISTTICKGNAHGLTSILNIHKKYYIKKIY